MSPYDIFAHFVALYASIACPRRAWECIERAEEAICFETKNLIPLGPRGAAKEFVEWFKGDRPRPEWLPESVQERRFREAKDKSPIPFG